MTFTRVTGRKVIDRSRLPALDGLRAAAHGVPVIDLYAQLCSTGYRPSVRGLRLYVDSLHFSDRAAPMLWSWMAPLLRDNDLRESTH